MRNLLLLIGPILLGQAPADQPWMARHVAAIAKAQLAVEYAKVGWNDAPKGGKPSQAAIDKSAKMLAKAQDALAGARKLASDECGQRVSSGIIRGNSCVPLQ